MSRVPKMPPVHPAADLFPMLDDAALQDLAADIKANGLQQPVVMLAGKLLDGRNRWRACEIAGVEPKQTQWKGDDPIAYVVSMNIRRRHMNESQRAMAAARAKALFEEEAQKRMRAGKADPSANLQKGSSAAQAAKLLNVSERSVESAAKVLKKGAPQLVAACDRGEIPVSSGAEISDLKREDQGEILRDLDTGVARNAKDALRQRNRQGRIEELERASKPLDIGRKFPVILADPPWEYDDDNSRGAALDHYTVTGTDEIAAMPVADHATRDAVLFLWATSTHLPDAFRVMEEWGFEYRASGVWLKSKIGLGHWFRIRHELILVGVRGKMVPPKEADRLDSVINAPTREHSRKPETIHEYIERMWPTLPRLEMFARRPRKGWVVWGNESEAKAS